MSPEARAALTELLQFLRVSGYEFITPTPCTHQRVLAHRSGQHATSLRDIFGWNLPFSATQLDLKMPAQILDGLRAADLVQERGNDLQATVRVSSFASDLFAHSAFPTVQDNAVFFGPDTYRFARFIRQALVLPLQRAHREDKPLRVLDVGCGSGAGGIATARALHLSGSASQLEVTMNDINPEALEYTAVNAAFAGVPVALVCADAFSGCESLFDVIVSNPPYLDDPAQRAYRHGGAGLGRALSVRIASDALPRLAPGGQLLLYTGVAIEAGVDAFLADMLPVLTQSGYDWSYSEIDPDVFGEELEQPAYRHIDRIAAVALIATNGAAPA